MKKACKEDGTEYYEYVLCYVDDVLCCSVDPKKIMDLIGKSFTVKPDSVHEPDFYLGAQVRKVELSPGKWAWGLSSDEYVKRSIAEVEMELRRRDKVLPKKVASPMSSGYRPELDASPELKTEKATYFQSVIGVLRWIIELGRIDIIVEVGLLSHYLAAPRVGHLEQVYHIFAYLKKYNRSAVVLDWTEPSIDESLFKEVDWSEYYPGVKETIPPNMPEPRGKPVVTTCYVDADHAGCRLTRRSHTGILIFVNRAPIVWYSKRQNTVESSTFGSEFVAARTAVDQVEALRYKLRMFGVPLEEPTTMFCDNESVVKNSTSPESTLKKKHNSICYHRVREALAGIPAWLRLAKIDGEENLSDPLTKVVVGRKRAHLFSRILW